MSEGAMTDDRGVRPPEGTFTDTYHWVAHQNGELFVVQWHLPSSSARGFWSFCGDDQPCSPRTMAADYWTYVGPVAEPGGRNG